MKLRNINKWGNSTVIMLTATDVKDLGIEVGKHEVDISNIVITKIRKKKK